MRLEALSSCIVMLRVWPALYNVVMMSVLKGLMKELYFTILSRRMITIHANFEVHCSHGLPVLT